MNHTPTTTIPRWFGQRAVSFARALPAVLALAALAVPETQAAPTTFSPARTNLLVAGDFEGISNPLPAYAATTTGVWATESSAIVSGVHNGITPFGSQMLELRHAGGGGAAQTNQVVYGPFKAGSVVTFSCKFNTWPTAPTGLSPGTAAVSIMTDTGIALTGTRYTSPDVTLTANTWKTASVTVTLPSDTNYLSAEIILWMFSNGSAYGTPLAYADDAVLTVAPHINWVNWTGIDTSSGTTKYVGQMVVPRTGGGSTTVNVKYTPPGGIAFFQSSNGTDYFAQGGSGSLGRLPNTSPYTSDKVGNIPDGGGGASDQGNIIALQYAGTNKLEFTDASTGQAIAIASPVFAYVSLNGNGYGFDQDFDILSFGDGTVRNQGYWGAGSSYKNVATVGSATQYQLLQAQNSLGGTEPHGTLQFRGSFATVTWQSLSNEYWNGFTIGVAQVADDVPIANAGPDQTVTQTSPSGASVQLSGSVTGSTKTPFTYTWTGAFGTATGSNPTVTLPVGTNTVTLVVTDAAGSTDSDTVVITVLPNPAPVITSPTTATATYGAAFSYTITATNSPTSFGATGLPTGLTLSGAVISGTPGVTGSFNIQLSAQNNGGTGTATLSLNIARAPATVAFDSASLSQTYDGTAKIVTATTNPAGVHFIINYLGDNTNAGQCPVQAIITDSHYTGPSITDTLQIAKANATFSITGYTGTYDGAAHGATGSASGVGGVDLSSGLNFGDSFTDVPGGTAHWTFNGGTNYKSTGGDVAIVITKADAAVTVTGYSGVYDGAAHGATGSATGVNRDDLSRSLDFGASFTNVPGGTAHWTFSGGTNYNDQSGDVTIAIAKANAAVIVTPYTLTYDGGAHSATVTSITGVNGETDATVGAVTLNTTHTDAGSYADSWSFTGTVNYNDIAATAITDTINKAPSTTTTAGAVPFTYDGTTHAGGSGTVTGAGTVTGSATLTYSGDQINAGSYTVTAHYAGDDNHTASDGAAVTITINKAPSTTTTGGAGPFTYDGTTHAGGSGTVTGAGIITGSATLTYSGDQVDAGSYTVTAHYAGDANHTASDGAPVTITINKAPSTTTTGGAGPFTYDGTTHAGGSGTVTGAGTITGSATLTYSGDQVDAGSYTVTAHYAGDANHTASDGAPVTITINKAATTTTLGAVPTIQAAGQPVTLTATVASLTTVSAGSVTFTMGSTVLGTTTVNGGVATLTTTAIPVGPQSISATYSGSSNFIGSASSAVSILVYGYPAGGGTFVIGDGNAAVGAAVNFWGAQWEKTNSLSGGASNASFKGFATGPTPPAVGGTFAAAPGNSGPSPASVPSYLGVIVTSKVTKSGSSITGTIVRLVVVKTDPGYAGDPGHAGTGTVVAVIP